MSMPAIVALAFASVVGIGISVAITRALGTRRAPRPAPPVPESSLRETAGIEADLAAVLRHPTISYYDKGAEDDSAFGSFKKELEGLFPRVHSELEREELGDRALLFTWRGSAERSSASERGGSAENESARPRSPESLSAGLRPAILCSHFDVVTAEDASSWRHAPFSGDRAEGFVWGRGAQDIKLTLVSALRAAEKLLDRGFSPKRTIYFAFGGDEEIGGYRGARLIGEALASRGVRASFLLDEGGPVSDGQFPFADRPLALVGVAEKGYMDVLVEAAGRGGHASTPPRRTAVGDLARAVAAIEAARPRARLGYTLRSFLDRVSPYAPFATRLLFRNLWLFAPIVKASFGVKGPTNALVRTTFAPTMLAGSAKENVLADRAVANVNVRILPGDSIAGALARLSRIAARFGATVRPAHPEALVEPLPESPLDHEGYRAIEAAMAASFPEAAILPFLFSAGTDTKHYREVAEAMYRLTPLRQGAADLERIHGRDERVEIGNLRRCALFYARLIESL